MQQFGKLVGIVRGGGAVQTGAGRRWGLSLDDRVLLVAVYYRTNLTLRQVALLFDVSKSVAGRVVDHLGPYLALSPVKRRNSPDMVLIVDGTSVHTHDRSMSASSTNYRYSTNLQVVIDANTRPTVAIGRPLPGNRNDCRAWRDSGVDHQCVDHQCRGAQVMADGGYPGNREVIMPYRKPTDSSELPGEGRPQHRPQASPCPRRTHSGAHEVLEHPAQLPTQTRRRLLRRQGCGPDA